MITSLSTVLEEVGESPGDEQTIRCRVQSQPLPGETGGKKTVYHIDDPYHDTDEEVFLSFWTEESTAHATLERTAPYVLSTLDIPTGEDLEHGGQEGGSLQRGEELLVRAIPNRRQSDGALYLNVTSFVIRTPDKLISKSKLRTQDRCPREYYLRYVKQVYPGDKFDSGTSDKINRFRGDAIHKAVELGLQNHEDRFRARSWTEEDIEEFCESMFDSEFGFRQALLIIAGAGLDVKEHVKEAVSKLFQNEEFCERIDAAESIDAERFLSQEFGYAGRVDIILDDVPLDIKTTRNPSQDLVEKHSRQVKLYLFGLLMERIEPGASFNEAISNGLSGEIVYPNTPDDSVRFEEVTLTMDDVEAFLTARNDVIATGDAFAPPSTYNRDCEGCAFARDEWLSGPDDALPPACTYHCQNERRWPCYDTTGELTSECSLFDSCDQRTQYRIPDVIDHYESVRTAFRAEESARKSAKRIVDKLDDDVLSEAGYLLSELECVGATAAGTVIRFTSANPVVPAFEPGDVVELERPSVDVRGRAVFYGVTDGEYLFGPLDDSVSLAQFLGDGAPARARYTFSVESVQDRYLPYLDFAQRRNEGEPRQTTRDDETTQGVPETVDPASLPEYLDREQVFVDVPVSTNRHESIAEIVRSLVTAPHPLLDEETTIPDSECRTLVLGTRPELVESAVAGQPAGDHYRLDGTGGDRTIQNDDGYHQIQTRLLDSRSIVSTVQQATSKAGPGGIREFFHRLQTAPFSDREHTSNFFDSLVILGAERLTEPEYEFLSDIADRVIAVGDVRRTGPDILSSAAAGANLDGYFETEFERYRSFPTSDAVSLQISGEAPPALRQFYRDGPWEALDGDLAFLSVQGDEETVLETVELESTVPAASGSGKRLVFDVTDTPLSPMAAHELFENRIELDATALQSESVVVLDDESLYLESKTPLDGGTPSHHSVVVRAVAAELPQFSRALLSNSIAERIVAEVVDQRDPDVVVTPFERHATGIKRELMERGMDVPVKRPESLDGTIVDHAVVSFATANDTGIVRPPLDDAAVLYSMLSSGRNLTMVGNGPTLRSKDVFDRLIDTAESYRE
ncbi:PD-(D/E)XK nuclease family protein [Haloarchaeobius amylolyticus]|uniref:PD-(D/E)XK nuclease family protein n=1 Tax=Haloarchaeobius amylolyticus TaxID=1198296 RepID=UPI00226D6062|nr:PD-(D/E)XK nuclease family protein [Haloarchaeobius amylolyticus]